MVFSGWAVGAVGTTVGACTMAGECSELGACTKAGECTESGVLTEEDAYTKDEGVSTERVKVYTAVSEDVQVWRYVQGVV